MGNYAAFGFGRPRFGNWATHGLGLTTFAPPPPEPTYPPLRTSVVLGEDAIPVIRDMVCTPGQGYDAILVPRPTSAQVAKPGAAAVLKSRLPRVRRDDLIRVPRPGRNTVKREDDC